MAEIKSLTNLTSPTGTESIPVQEAGGTLKRVLVSWFAKAADVAMLFSYFTGGAAKNAIKTGVTAGVYSGTASAKKSLAQQTCNIMGSFTILDKQFSDAPSGWAENDFAYVFHTSDAWSSVQVWKSYNYGDLRSWTRYVGHDGTATAWTPLTDVNGNPVFPSVATTASAANAYIGADGTTILKSTSSRRYKTNILPLADSSIIDIMEPITYTSDPETVPTDDPDVLHYGFIAEDLAEIDPKLVQYTEDADGNLIPDGVQYDRITVLLVKRIQELEARLKKAGI